jgi:hypothetical protein
MKIMDNGMSESRGFLSREEKRRKAPMWEAILSNFS